MDISSMMAQVKAAAAQRVAAGLPASRGNGVSTSATATRGATAAVPTSNAEAATTSTTSDSEITSSDFLTLLVTEMQNQDPTQPTDPNAYIQQLVEVNSLQQLISINTDLGGNAATSTSTSSAAAASKAVSGVSAPGSLAATSVATAAPTSSIFGSQDQVS